MKHYKNAKNEIYAFEADGSQDAYIPANLVPITIEEADKLRNPPPTPEQIQEQINAEAKTYLDSTDWLVIRHKDQLDLGITPSLTDEEYKQLLTDRQSARESVL